jgi:endonuclease III
MDSISAELIRQGQALWRAPREQIAFTGQAAADRLLNDLEHTPHAFVLACLMDRQIRAELAWLIPFQISEKLQSNTFERLAALTLTDFEQLMSVPAPLHRFPLKMAKTLHAAVRRIEHEYHGRADILWLGKPSSAEVVYRLLQFEGAGPKIATMAANILAREFKIEFSDYYSIDISLDVHVRRVMARLGLISANASDEQMIYKARAISPDFPGLLDFPLWSIGRSTCRPAAPHCAVCPMRETCPTSLNLQSSRV